MSKNNGGFFLGAVFGAAIAGVSALLFAPKTGEEFRKEIKDEMDELKLKANDYKDYAVERGTEFYDSASETTEDIKVNLKYSADQLKSQFDDVSQDAAEEFKHLKNEFVKSKDKLASEGSEFYNDAKGEIQATGEIVKEEVVDSKEELSEKEEF